MSRRHVHVHIDELVLHGFPGGDRDRIGDAVQAELGRLLGERTLLPTVAQRVDGGEFRAAATPAAVGAQIAGAVARALPTGGRK